MAYTYEWKVKSIKKAENANDLSNVIIGTQWIVTAITENGYSASFNGATPFTPADVDPNNFTPYEELTEETVLGWIKNVASGSTSMPGYWDHISERIQKDLDKEIQNHKTLETVDLPWYVSGSTDEVSLNPTAHLDN